MGNLSEMSAQSADTVDERSADQIVAAKEAVEAVPDAAFATAEKRTHATTPTAGDAACSESTAGTVNT